MKKIYLFILFLSGSFYANAQCTDLFISEYVEGSSLNKAIELFNPTSTSIDLSAYRLEIYNNGSLTASSTFNLTGSISAQSTYVLMNSNADSSFQYLADTLTGSSVINFNGNDALALFNNTDTLDIIGKIGENPGAGYWDVDTGSTKDFSLTRNNNVSQGEKNWITSATQWVVYAMNDVSHLGSHSSLPCAITNTILPCSELFISEYVEGSSLNKAIELFNPTSISIDLSAYRLEIYNNGNDTVSSTFDLAGNISAYSTYVIMNSSTDSSFQYLADTLTGSSVINFNGNDALALFNNSDTLDIIGKIGDNPGAGYWDVDTGSTKDYSLVRNASVSQGEKNWITGATQWVAYAKNDASHLGSHSSSACVITNIDKTAFDDEVSLYPNPVREQLSVNNISPNAVISIYNMLGKKISFPFIFIDSNLLINTSKLENGVYLLSIYANNQHIVKRFVKE
jgi:predicted extracellular nuclease